MILDSGLLFGQPYKYAISDKQEISTLQTTKQLHW